VFEVRGSIGSFAAAIRNVPGLELIDEEELQADEDKAPTAYLMVPDVRALRELESLWRRWRKGALEFGETPWRDVFSLLRDLRPWGPGDRVQPVECDILSEVIFGLADDDPVRLEIELVYRTDFSIGEHRAGDIRSAVIARGGRVVATSRIDDIAYHAMLVDLPVRAVREIIDHSHDGIAGLEPVMHIRPQSIASKIDVTEDAESNATPATGALGEPILALLDGVPVAAHPLLASHVVVDDQFDLERNTQVTDRVHGTAIASLIVHGDRNGIEQPLPRRIHVVPVLGEREEFPVDRLIVDVVYTAVVAMRDGPSATAPGVLIVNLSLGNPRRPFHGQLSAWARLLDRLSYRFGLLFIVSAGNCTDPFPIKAFGTHTVYEQADRRQRATETLRALGELVSVRRLYSPAETVNGLTVGAYNSDAVSAADRATARVNVDPYGDLRMANPSSALGPGFARSVKPEVLLPGAREHLRFSKNDPHLEVKPAGAARSAGLRVAAPPTAGHENRDGYINGTSAAAALGSRTAHRIHDALEAEYGDDFMELSHVQRAVLIKALLAHPAKWPVETSALIGAVIGPPEPKYSTRRKDNIRRFLGYGMIDPEDAVACADDRAVFWATGLLQPNKIATVFVPVPVAIGGKALPHALSATLAWFTPTSPGRMSYRAVRLRLLEPAELGALSVKPHGNQPDSKQTSRGTLFTRSWQGERAPVVGQEMSIGLIVQRDPDQGLVIDEPVPFGLAVTLTMPGVLEIYEQVRQRLGIVQRVRGERLG
jgi:hypothetical protein